MTAHGKQYCKSRKSNDAKERRISFTTAEKYGGCCAADFPRWKRASLQQAKFTAN
jgi:hypothetical protein